MANITVCFPIPAANWFCFRRQKVNLASILQGLRNHAAPNPDPFKSVRTSLCANIYLYGVILSSFFFFHYACIKEREKMSFAGSSKSIFRHQSSLGPFLGTGKGTATLHLVDYVWVLFELCVHLHAHLRLSPGLVLLSAL